MGLGLFISKTLLERTGGEMSFSNATRPGRRRPETRSGAVVEVIWPVSAIAAGGTGGGLGENTPIEA